ncbi:hypothetical protein AX17_005954, partial [Amanita inopinata Kibby_2008]
PVQNRCDMHCIILGIDTSIWIYETGKALWKMNHAQAGSSPEFRTLFYRLARLLQSPIIPVFMFDGEAQPSHKRNRAVRKIPHWMTQPFQELIEVFSFYLHMAPGEAEVELAMLCHTHVIDAVVTNDCDIFVFGATHVIRSKSFRNNLLINDLQYIPEAQQQQGLSLHRNCNHGNFLLITLLVGGDYDTVGLHGCGVTLASKLMKSGLGQLLLQAAKTQEPQGLAAYLQVWREQLHSELMHNPHKHLSRKYRALAQSIPNDFPSLQVIASYVNPITSWSDGANGPNNIAWLLWLPDLAGLGHFCKDEFTWATATAILNKFYSIMWKGVCTRLLIT